MREARLAREISRKRLAELLQVTRRHLCRLQAGECLPSELIAERFFAETGVRLPLPKVASETTRTGQRMALLAREKLQLPRALVVTMTRPEFRDAVRLAKQRREEEFLEAQRREQAWRQTQPLVYTRTWSSWRRR